MQCSILDNEIDGSILLKLSESMVARLFPTMKLEVQFLELLQILKQRHTLELNCRKSSPTSSFTNSHSSIPSRPRISPFDHGNDHSSNSNSPISIHAHPPTKLTYAENFSATKTLKREPKHFITQ